MPNIYCGREVKNSVRAALLACAALCLPAGPAIAQDASQPGDESGGALSQIVVTAQKRAENLQDVPVAVTALTQEALTGGGVFDTTDLQVAVPGLVSQQLSNAFIPYIRGVGSNNPGAGNESSVAIYLDGVYQGAKGNNILDLANIERIEVLKGPQGTFLGVMPQVAPSMSLPGLLASIPKFHSNWDMVASTKKRCA